MAERGPGGIKLLFAADATADCDEAKQTFQASGLSGARLTVSKESRIAWIFSPRAAVRVP